MAVPTKGLVAMTAAQYHADPCREPSLSSHMAHTLVSKSPAHAWLAHPRLGAKPRKTTKAFTRGDIFHAMLLDTADDVLVPIDASNYRTKAAQEQRDAAIADGKAPLLAREVDEYKQACTVIIKQLLELGIRLTGASEVAAFWQERADDGFMVQCRGLLDHVIVADGVIIDLKTCRSAHPDACRKHIEGYGYDIQCVAYKRALEQIRPEHAGRSQYKWLFIESEEPYCVTPVEPAGSMEQLGELRWAKAVNLWRKCTLENDWPAYTRETIRVEASKWALEGVYADMEAEAEAQE